MRFMLFHLLTYVSAAIVLMVLFEMVDGMARVRALATADDSPAPSPDTATRACEEARTLA